MHTNYEENNVRRTLISHNVPTHHFFKEIRQLCSWSLCGPLIDPSPLPF